MTEGNTVTLYRPVGPQELALIEASSYREFPPRLPEQPTVFTTESASQSSTSSGAMM